MAFSSTKEDAPTRRYLRKRSVVAIQRQPRDQTTS